MLKPDVKEKWTAALRSGNFEQGSEMLADESVDENGNTVWCYCCLGVLQTLYPEVLPQMDCGDELLDIQAANDICGLPYDIQNELASMNDAGMPFAQIADYIEANL